jgi:hypothetical protein
MEGEITTKHSNTISPKMKELLMDDSMGEVKINDMFRENNGKNQ